MDFYTQYRYLIVPFVTWFCVQTFKVLWELATTKKFNFKRIIGAGGMPSSHTAIVCIYNHNGWKKPRNKLSNICCIVDIFVGCNV